MISLHFGWTDDRSKIEKISKALADNTRLKIFEAISASDHMTCGEIVSMRRVTPATVSHHLKILSEAGWPVGAKGSSSIAKPSLKPSQRTRGRSRKSRAARKHHSAADSC